MLSPAIIKKLDLLLYIFLGLSFITSQLSVALSSIGVVGTIILLTVKFVLTGEKPKIDKTLLFLISFFVLWQIITSLFSSDPASALTGTIKKASIYFVLFGSITFIDSTEKLKKYFVTLFVFSAVVSSYETVRYLIDFNAQNELSLSDFRIRYFGYPITIGEIKMIILIIIFVFLLSGEKLLIPKWVLVLLIVPVLLSLYFTNTRNAMLGLFAALLVIGAIKHRYFLAGLIVVVVVFLYFAPISVKERILSIGDLNHPNNVVRFTMWDVGGRMIKDRPIAGFGDVDILSVYKTYKNPEAYGEGSHMHNNFLHIAVLYGIPGLIIWLALMAYIFLRQIKIFIKVKDAEFLNILVLSSLASMISFQISGLTEWSYGDAEFVVVLWFVFSLPFIAEKIYRLHEIE